MFKSISRRKNPYPHYDALCLIAHHAGATWMSNILRHYNVDTLSELTGLQAWVVLEHIGNILAGSAVPTVTERHA